MEETRKGVCDRCHKHSRALTCWNSSQKNPVWLCPECGLPAPLQSNEARSIQHEGPTAEYDSTTGIYSTGRTIAEVYEFLHRNMPYSTNETAHGHGAEDLVTGYHSILDAGAGRTSWVLGRAPKVGVMDIAPSACHWLSARDHSWQVIHHDITKPWPLADGSWEVVTSFDVLEHIPPEQVGFVIEQAARVASRRMVFLIAEFESDSGPGNERLHLTVQAADWWEKKLLKHSKKWSVQSVDTGKRNPFWVLDKNG